MPQLLKSLRDPEFVDRGNVISLLGHIHSRPRKVVPVLVRYAAQTNLTIKQPKDYFMHLAAIRALGRFGTNSNVAIPILETLLRSSDFTERMVGATTLLALNHSLDAALAIIQENLHQKSPSWESQLSELSMIGFLAKPALPLLLEGLQDSNPDVQRNFKAALRRIAPDVLNTNEQNRIHQSLSDI